MSATQSWFGPSTTLSRARSGREMIATLAARHKLPAVYAGRDFVASGGLISYAADFLDQYRQAAEYTDRILKGEKPADLPVQALSKLAPGCKPELQVHARELATGAPFRRQSDRGNDVRRGPRLRGSRRRGR